MKSPLFFWGQTFRAEVLQKVIQGNMTLDCGIPNEVRMSISGGAADHYVSGEHNAHPDAVIFRRIPADGEEFIVR